MTDKSGDYTVVHDAMLRTCLTAAPIGIGLVRDRVFQWVNTQLADMLGYSIEDFPGKSARMLYATDAEFERVGSVKYAQIARTGIGDVETQFVHRDGSVIDVVLSSAMIDRNDPSQGTIFTALDITDRLNAEKALTRSEQRYKLATISGRTAVWEYRISTQEVFFDPGILNLIGYESELLSSGVDKWLELIHEEDLPRLLELRERIAFEGEGKFRTTYRIRHKDGSYRWFETRGDIIKSDDGSVDRLMGTSTDVTEQRQMEEALREKEAHHHQQLMHADRLLTVGRLAAGVAHEINNPLAVLYGSLQEIAGDNSDDITVDRDTVDRMLRTSRRIRDIVNNLLVFSRQKSSDKSVRNINEVVESSLLHVGSHAIKKGVEIDLSLGENLPLVSFNEQHIQQVLLNIVFNAFDAMPDGGRLEVRTGATDAGVVVRLRDTGQGIAPTDIDRIFTPFFTTKEVGAGTGLGLSISYGIVKDHGGTLIAHSDVGKGAEFVMTLPVGGPSEGSHDADSGS